MRKPNNGIRPAASPEQLSGYAKAIGRILGTLEVEDDGLGCGVCGCGGHVPKCPVPALREAQELLSFMADIPVASVATRGTTAPAGEVA
jgi:hypothetical protein